ncbi:ribosomal protein S18-alanine N-acetyltransferase [Thalassotalea fusca]
MANISQQPNQLISFQPTSPDVIAELMRIENACHSHPWSEKTMLSCIGGRYFGYYAQSKSQEMLGFYIGEYVAGESTLMDICVNPSAQNKGIGKQLLHHYHQQAQALGAELSFLEVRAKNLAALMLYINQEYVEINRRTGYYPAETGYEDAIVMRKSFK